MFIHLTGQTAGKPYCYARIVTLYEIDGSWKSTWCIAFPVIVEVSIYVSSFLSFILPISGHCIYKDGQSLLCIVSIGVIYISFHKCIILRSSVNIIKFCEIIQRSTPSPLKNVM